MNQTLLASIAALAVTTSPGAQVRRVPSQYTTIAAALTGAPAGTTVLVAPGTYNEVITWPGVDGLRLISESGWAVTRIDARQQGRPLTFSAHAFAPITRSTLVSGFEITGGLQTSDQSLGGGIQISDASPTLRGNRITGNVCAGRLQSFGGGIEINGGRALITGNLIDSNEARDANYNEGAGIRVNNGVMVEIVGNTIRANKNRSTSATSGNYAFGAGIYTTYSNVLVASNLVVDNECSVPYYNFGAGIHAALGFGTPGVNVTIVNNTIAGNMCHLGFFNYGGGLQLRAPTQNGALIVVGNIITGNTALRGGGGVLAETPIFQTTLDWNDIWNNAGGDYSGLTPGPNDVSVDPQFASATTYDLSAASPLIDAMPATLLPASVRIDYRGGARRVDGNADGLAGNGARLDIGGAEFATAALTASAPFALGTTPLLHVTAAQTSRFLLLLDVVEGNTLVEPVGTLLLSPSCIVLLTSAAPISVPLPLPLFPPLVGLTVHFQAIVSPLANPPVGTFTNAVTATLF